MVGVNFAKGLSIAKNIPLVGVNHMEGHLFSNFIDLRRNKISKKMFTSFRWAYSDMERENIKIINCYQHN